MATMCGGLKLNTMLGEIVGSSLGGVFGMVSDHFNRKQQRKINEQARQDTAYYYAKDREYSLADWNMQNAYNSPKSQMARLKEAKLNPHLMYKSGSVDNVGGVVRGSQGRAANLTAPRYDTSIFNNALATYASLRQINAGVNKTNADTDLTRKHILMADMDIAGKAIQNAHSKLSYKQASDLYNTVIEKAKLENLNLGASTFTMLDRNDRERIANTVNVTKTVQEILNLKAQKLATERGTAKTIMEMRRLNQEIENLKNASKSQQLENDIKTWENDLRKRNLSPSDPAAMRKLDQILNNFRRWNSPRTLDSVRTY